MNAIELVITVCSILHGAQCSDKTLVFQDVSLLTCMVSAQPVIAEWQNVHPNYSVRNWQCRNAGQFAKA